MAAYAALVSLINDLELIPNHPRHSFSFENKQIASLTQTVHFLISFLESYDSHGCSREAAQVLESLIASVAHAAHDVVESHVVHQIHVGSTLCGKPRSYFLLNLQKAIDNMNFVERKVIRFKAKSGIKGEQPTHSTTTALESQASGKNNRLVGVDAVADRLLGMLVGEPSSQKLVIPIVGMGGMGKTTLAKYAYQHSLVEYHFDVRHWATISQEYSAHTNLTQLLFGQRITTGGGSVNGLGEQLRKDLWGRRYLIVLDDMWSMEAWDKIQMFLPDNGNGSRVVITTRLCDLVSNLRFSPFMMEFLDEGQSWKLFCREAFDEEDCPLELEGIGKKIVRKCQGLPLSIVVIGGHLRKSSRAIEYWKEVANLMNPISSSEEGEKCMEIISVSYDQLPICLKPCFLYMGEFREDELIGVAKLLRLWIAEGFLRAKEGLSLEEVAEDYLNDLIDRNLVIVHRKRWNGKPETCGIHDIVRELCMKVGKKEKLVRVLHKTEGVGRECDIESAPHELRSITFYVDELPLELTKLLRVSEGGCSFAADLQPVNLRYLAWHSFDSNSVIYTLPCSIFLFWNLQALIMTNYYRGITAPQEIWDMVQLRHLEFFQLHLSDPLPTPRDQEGCINVLGNLQTLLGVRNLRLTEEVCQRMPNIKNLHVSYGFESCSGYYHRNLSCFTKLESLNLYGLDHVQSFTFPSSLQELDLGGFNLRWGDVGVIAKSLPHLGVLHLHNVNGNDWSPAGEEFPSLKSLAISSCDDLVYWNANSSHFPVLVALHMKKQLKLSEIPFDIGDIPTLAYIELECCSVSAAVSAMRIVVEQQSFGNHDLHLHVEFQRMEEVERFHKMVQEEDLISNNLHLSCRNHA